MTTEPMNPPAGAAPAAQAAIGGPLEGGVALVTGGARGLGAEICRELAGAGMTVVAADVRNDLAAALCDELTAAGQHAEPLALDITDAPAAEREIERLIARHGALDVLVNNAGIDRTVAVDELEVDEWDRIMAVNLRAPFVLSRGVLPHMRERGRGHIINIVSTAAKRAWANAAAYHASKWGLLGFSHALHVEARTHGVKVTAIVAGGMRTPFLFERFPDLDPGVLQDPRNVAATVRFVLTQPAETVIPELMVLPMRENSWP
ncbi:MAG TPA: SDR family oxidoreductase [Candidatus Caenarcaniphilales bacterium]|nr:SDR family oxidoreductase [Candidatus Caenarcaniphilales bacterium]